MSSESPVVVAINKPTVLNAAIKSEKSDQFNGHNFKTCQQKMQFYHTNLCLTKYLKDYPSVINENETNTEKHATFEAWGQGDYLCRKYILNGLSNELYNMYCVMKSAKELSESLGRKYYTGAKKFVAGELLDYKMVGNKTKVSQMQDLQLILREIHAQCMTLSESFQVACVIENLSMGWKNFKNYLKHKRNEKTLEDLIVRLLIEENSGKSENKHSGVPVEAHANVVIEHENSPKRKELQGQNPNSN